MEGTTENWNELLSTRTGRKYGTIKWNCEALTLAVYRTNSSWSWVCHATIFLRLGLNEATFQPLWSNDVLPPVYVNDQPVQLALLMCKINETDRLTSREVRNFSITCFKYLKFTSSITTGRFGTNESVQWFVNGLVREPNFPSKSLDSFVFSSRQLLA